MGAGDAQPPRIRTQDAPSNPGHRPLGGQHTLTLFGVPGFNFRESAAEAKAENRQEATANEREAARRETANCLREFRKTLSGKLASAQVQATPTPVAPERQLFGIARAIAEIPRDGRAARQAACEAVARSDRERQRRLAERYPATPAIHRATKPASAFNASAGGLTRPARSAAFCEDAQAEYEAHMAEIAEARSHQLDAEADRYACSYAGAGYTEYLMAIEG